MRVRLVAVMIVTAVVLLCGMSSCASAEAAGAAHVYICTGPKAKVFHCTPDCKGLGKCSGEVKKVRKVPADRRPCKICF